MNNCCKNGLLHTMKTNTYWSEKVGGVDCVLTDLNKTFFLPMNKMFWSHLRTFKVFCSYLIHGPHIWSSSQTCDMTNCDCPSFLMIRRNGEFTISCTPLHLFFFFFSLHFLCTVCLLFHLNDWRCLASRDFCVLNGIMPVSPNFEYTSKE